MEDLSALDELQEGRTMRSRTLGDQSGAGRSEWIEMGGELFEQLHERRADFERLVVRQFPRVFGQHDAEDIVSTALQRALATSARPEPGAERSWFETVVMNAARDELRTRGGRSRAGGPWRKTVLLSQLQEHGYEVPAEPDSDEETDTIDRLDAEVDREHMHRVARRALSKLQPEEVRLLMLRHHSMAHATRDECAAAAGLTIAGWRHRYRRAWNHFVSSVSSDEPTPRCREVRELIGEIEAGDLEPGAAAMARGRLDVHMMECGACHAFARETYHVLSPQWLGTGAAVAAGAGVIGVGAAAWIGGLGGVAQVATALCVVSITTAGICGGVIAVMNAGEDAPPKRVPQKIAEAPTPSPTPVPTVVRAATPRPTPSPTPTPRPRRRPKPETSPARATTRSASETQPAAAPTGSTGNEFDPLPEAAAAAPAPVSSGVNQEFAP